MDMPKPTTAHQKLSKLVERWSGPEKMPPGPWAPEGGTALGRVENREGLDGFVVIQDYAQERDGEVVFRGHGVFGWNAGAGHYTLHWFDSMGMGANAFRGRIELHVNRAREQLPLQPVAADCRSLANERLGLPSIDVDTEE